MSEEAKKSIVNLGIIDVSKCPQLYNECDALFLPTLLECFSANYVEAMKMRKPIVTSNLPFATNVCKNAALYFDPMNAHDIVEKFLFWYEISNYIEICVLRETWC
ncbi:glycosyltransferase [Bacteroides fragilis]